MKLKPLIIPFLVSVSFAILAPNSTASPTPAFSRQDREYWAFQPLHPTAPPAARDTKWARNPVDRFVVARLEQSNLKPSPPAPKAGLARRAYLDLLGVPPTPTQLEAFLDDPSPDAFDRLVDRLLESPQYGERQARLWLDLVRYADSDGYKADVYRPHAWRYRDYVIRSFNADKPYDRFLQEQLAGDELFPGDLDALTATGFLRLWPYEDNQIDVRRQWVAILDDITEITGEALLGLGLKCARCHDHKFDPILQKDYYRIQAFFAPIVPDLDPGRFPLPELAASRAQRQDYDEKTAGIRALMQQMRAPLEKRRYEAVYKKLPEYLQAIYDKPASEQTPLDRQFVHMGNLQIHNKGGELKFKGETAERWKSLSDQLKEFDDLKPADAPPIMGVMDIGPEAPPTLLKEEAVEPGFPSILSPEPAAIQPPPDNPNSTGRRTALAHWITQPDNPLTLRVLVNRVWQQHFDIGIVATPNDFGRQGTAPTHPELLDWLAQRFAEEGWSLKKLHKLLMTSATYRQDSLTTPSPQALRADPDNRLLWRMRPRRLDGDQIRDAMLEVSGELLPRAGGAGADADDPCRSIYLKNIRNRQDPMLQAFDGPDMFNSCARRNTTTTPIQSLLLLNSEWSLARAKAFARRIRKETAAADSAGRIEHAYRLAFSRSPNPVELATARQFLNSRSPDQQNQSWVDLCHVLLNANEFVYVD